MIIKLLNLLYSKSTLKVFVFNICFPCFGLLKALDWEKKVGSGTKEGGKEIMRVLYSKTGAVGGQALQSMSGIWEKKLIRASELEGTLYHWVHSLWGKVLNCLVYRSELS